MTTVDATPTIAADASVVRASHPSGWSAFR